MTTPREQLIAAAEEVLEYLRSYWASEELEKWDAEIDKKADTLEAAIERMKKGERR